MVFVRYALPGERVRVRITSERGSYWHADAVEVLDASPDRVEPCCVRLIAGPGWCGLPGSGLRRSAAAQVLKGQVVANQLARLGNYQWDGPAEPIGDGGAQGWRTRVRLAVGPDGRAGFHRYHSDEVVTDLRLRTAAGRDAGRVGRAALAAR